MARIHSHSYKQKRRKQIMRYCILAGIFCCSVFFASLYWSWNDHFMISRVRITGIGFSDEQAIRSVVERNLSGKIAFLYPRANVFLYPASSIERDILSQFKTIKDVTFEIQNQTTLHIVVHERTPFALWCGTERSTSSPCSFVDSAGYIFSDSPRFSGSTYTLFYSTSTDGYVAPSELFQNIISLSSVIKKAGIPIQEYEIKNNTCYGWSGGLSIIMQCNDTPAQIEDTIETLLSDSRFASSSLVHYQYIDIRMKNKVTYKKKE